jgi:hypothetical protein
MIGTGSGVILFAGSLSPLPFHYSFHFIYSIHLLYVYIFHPSRLPITLSLSTQPTESKYCLYVFLALLLIIFIT